MAGKKSNPDTLLRFLTETLNNIYKNIDKENFNDQLCANITRTIITNLIDFSPDHTNRTIEQIAIHLLKNLQTKKETSYKNSRNAQKYCNNQDKTQNQEQVCIVNNLNSNEIITMQTV